MRFKRAAGEDAHIQVKTLGKSWTALSLCGLDVDDKRSLAPYEAASDKAIAFWEIVCAHCGRVMDDMDPTRKDT